MESRIPEAEEISWLRFMISYCKERFMDIDQSEAYLSRSYNIHSDWTDFVWQMIEQENQGTVIQQENQDIEIEQQNQDAIGPNNQEKDIFKNVQMRDRRRPAPEEITWLRPMMSNCVAWGMDRDQAALYLARTYNINPNWTDEVWQVMKLPESPVQPKNDETDVPRINNNIPNPNAPHIYLFNRRRRQPPPE